MKSRVFSEEKKGIYITNLNLASKKPINVEFDYFQVGCNLVIFTGRLARVCMCMCMHIHTSKREREREREERWERERERERESERDYPWKETWYQIVQWEISNLLNEKLEKKFVPFEFVFTSTAVPSITYSSFSAGLQDGK